MPVKSRAPEYPRPIPPVYADEAPITHDTIVYYDPSDDIVDDERRRAGKRRRIEAHATSYLRGKPLFILSAGLKGPFDDGWRNPWATKRSIEHPTDGTARRLSPRQAPTPTHWTVQPSPRSTEQHGRLVTAEAKIEQTKRESNPFDYDEGPISSGANEPRPIDVAVFGSALRKEDDKVQDWLKTNEAYETSEDLHHQSSPVSPSRVKSKPRESLKFNTDFPPIKDLAVPVASDDHLPPPHVLFAEPLKQPTKSLLSSVKPRPMSADHRMNDICSSPLQTRSEQIPLQKQDQNAHPPCTNSFRAEHAFANSRQGAAQKSTTPVTSEYSQPDVDVIRQQEAVSKLSEPALKSPSLQVHGQSDLAPDAGVPPASPQASPYIEPHLDQAQSERESVVDVDFRSAANQDSASLHTAPEVLPAVQNTRAAISLAREATKSSTMTDLPSAQVPQVPILPSLTSHLSDHDQMLQSLPHHSTKSAVGNNEDNDAASFLLVPVVGAGHLDQHRPPDQDSDSLARPQVINEEIARPPPEHAEGGAASALELDPGLIKVIKKSAGASVKLVSAVGLKKMGASSSRRRQAFAGEDKSSSSIKSALRVAKTAATRLERPLSTKTLLQYAKDQRLLENEMDCSPAGDYMHENVSRGPALRSILKPLPQHSTGVSVSNAGASSSMKQDAQRPQKLNPVVFRHMGRREAGCRSAVNVLLVKYMVAVRTLETGR